MSFKKIVTTFFVSLFALVLPLSSAVADSPGWQLLTHETAHWNSTLNAWITGVNNAHASGNVRICNEDSKARLFTLKEYDPDNPDDVIAANQHIDPRKCRSYDIRSWVDGTNKKAEIYVQTQSSYSTWTIWD